MAYVDADFVRGLTYLSTSQISDADLTTLIGHATSMLNKDINVLFEDEKVEFINNEKENDIDDSNTTFYTKHFPLGDKDNDGNVDGNDLDVYTIDSDGNRTSYTVSSVDDASIGKFTLSSAPTTDENLYVTYSRAPIGMVEDDSNSSTLIRLACAYRAISLAFTKLKAGKIQKIRLGNIRVMMPEEGFKEFDKEYMRTIRQINRISHFYAEREGIDFSEVPSVDGKR